MRNLVFVPKIGCKSQKYMTAQFSSIFELSNDEFSAITHLTRAAYKRSRVIFPWFNAKKYFECNSWKQSYKLLDKIANEYDQVITCGNDVYDAAKRIGEIYEKTLEQDNFSMSFIMSKKVFKYICGIEHLIRKGMKVKALCPDPQEPRFNVPTYYVYPYQGMKFFPSLEYGFFYRNLSKPTPKEQEFVFGVYINHEDRKWLQEIIPKLPEHVLYKDKFTGHDTSVDYFTYMGLLIASKFTLIVPSYDIDTFSANRFFEALACNCVPLIYKTTKYKEWGKMYPDWCKILDDLVVDVPIKFPDYAKTLARLKNCASYKKLLNINFYKSHLRRFLNE